MKSNTNAVAADTSKFDSQCEIFAKTFFDITKDDLLINSDVIEPTESTESFDFIRAKWKVDFRLSHMEDE